MNGGQWGYMWYPPCGSALWDCDILLWTLDIPHVEVHCGYTVSWFYYEFTISNQWNHVTTTNVPTSRTCHAWSRRGHQRKVTSDGILNCVSPVYFEVWGMISFKIVLSFITVYMTVVDYLQNVSGKTGWACINDLSHLYSKSTGALLRPSIRVSGVITTWKRHFRALKPI